MLPDNHGCYLDVIYYCHENRPLGMSVQGYLDKINHDGKTHSHGGWNHFPDWGPGLEGKEKRT